jgi:ubiquinol-cytochrome c reductase iron-sulfur subunit
MSDANVPQGSSDPAGAVGPGESTAEVPERDLGDAPGGAGAGGSRLRPDAEVRPSGSAERAAASGGITDPPTPGHAPVRHVGPPPQGGPAGPPGPAVPQHATSGNFEIDTHQLDPAEDRRAERRVAITFVLTVVATFAFIGAYIFMKIHNDSYGSYQNYVLGSTLAVALFAFGTGQILWAKQLIPHEYAVQDRHDGASSREEREALEETFLAGADQLGIGRRHLARRTLLLAAGVFPLSGVVLLRDLGPAPEKKLRHTAWRKGSYLVDVETKQRVKLGDLRVGAIRTVLPEKFDELTEEDWATSPTILLRLRAGEDRPLKGRENWGVDGHVAYSKICTHAGCPTSLYETQTQHLLCPCHQSTFKVTEGCKVIFGPAARALPQLPISVDNEGYFLAEGDYREPVGPSFWERG